MAYDPTFGKGTSAAPSTTNAPTANSYNPSFGKAGAPATPYFQGGGYGASNITDTSGRPLLTYANQEAKASQLLSDRTDATFDITKPQKLTMAMMHNGRMPEAMSQQVRDILGATPDQQLDHLISLELGGSNQPENLALENNQGGKQPSVPTENAIAKRVANGEISYIDGQKEIARAKGIQLPDDSSFSSSDHPLASNYGPKEKSFIDLVKGDIGALAGGFAENNLPVQIASALRTKGFLGGLEYVGGRIINQIQSGQARFSRNDKTGKINFDPRDLTNMAVGGLSAPEEISTLIAKSTNPGEIASILKNLPGIASEDIPTLSKALAETKTVEGVNRILEGKPEGTFSPTDGVTASPPTPLPIKNSQEDLIFQGGAPNTKSAFWSTRIGEANAYAAQKGMTNGEIRVARFSDLPDEIKNGMTKSEYEKTNGSQIGVNKEFNPELVGKYMADKSGLKSNPEEFTSLPIVSSRGTYDEKFNRPGSFDKPEGVLTDEQAQSEAQVKTLAGSGAKGVSALDKPTAQAYRDWVNEGGHSSQALSGRIASNQFEDARPLGMNAIYDLQAGKLTDPALINAKNFLQDLLDKEQATGIPVDEKTNYVPQYWSNSQEEIQRAYERYAGAQTGKNVSLRPGFTKESTFPDYKTGMEYGLTPRYNNLPDIINARIRASEKALSDRKFYDYLSENNLIQPSNRVGRGWKTLNADSFPRFPMTISSGEIYNGTVSAPENLAKLINNQLRVPEGFGEEALAKTANFATKLKNVVLSAGVPGTAINMHGFNELAATVPEVLNQPSLFTSALQYLFYPKAAGNFVQENLALARDAARSGLTISAEDHSFDEIGRLNVVKTIFDKAGVVLKKGTDTLYKLFGSHDFEEMIPALKLKMWSDLKSNLMTQGYDEVDAARLAAEKANNTFGGVNYAALGRDKNLQNFLRAAIFAPDFWESRLRYAGAMGKSLFSSSDPLASTYRKAVVSIVGSYIGMNLWNKKTLGRYMFQNPAGHEMDVYVGHDSQGKDIWVRPFGTSLDFLRLPLDIGRSAQQGDLSPVTALFRNRVSTILQPIVSTVANVDAYGNPIFGPDKYGNPQSVPRQVQNFASSLPVVPQIVAGGAALTDPTKSKAQDISQALSLPVRFNSPANKGDVQNLKTQAAEAVRNGDYGPLDALVKNGVIKKQGRALFIKDAKRSPADIKKQKDKNAAQSKQQRSAVGDLLGL